MDKVQEEWEAMEPQIGGLEKEWVLVGMAKRQKLAREEVNGERVRMNKTTRLMLLIEAKIKVSYFKQPLQACRSATSRKQSNFSLFWILKHSKIPNSKLSLLRPKL